MTKRYNIIYADPPWAYRVRLDPGRRLKYPTMSVAEIAALRVEDIAADDCALFMWAVFPQLEEALTVIKGWGFGFKTCAFVWVKTNKLTEVNQASFFPADSFDSFWGLGRWTRANAEIVLLAFRGKPERKSGAVHQIIYAPIDVHSRKPAETRHRIVQLMGDVPRVELFAREATAGWDVWGNEIPNDVEICGDVTTEILSLGTTTSRAEGLPQP